MPEGDLFFELPFGLRAPRSLQGRVILICQQTCLGQLEGGMSGLGPDLAVPEQSDGLRILSIIRMSQWLWTTEYTCGN